MAKSPARKTPTTRKRPARKPAKTSLVYPASTHQPAIAAPSNGGMEPVVNELLQRMEQGHGIEGPHAPALRPGEVAERLSTTFAPGWMNHDGWEQQHLAAIDDARALLDAPLTRDITREFDRVTAEYRLSKLTPGEWCDLIEHQVTELRDLEGAAEDIEAPDTQARDRLVKIAALSIACADILATAIDGRSRGRA